MIQPARLAFAGLAALVLAACSQTMPPPDAELGRLELDPPTVRTGVVLAFGPNGQGQNDVPVGLTDVTAVAAGAYHSVALRADGTVVTWGLGTGSGVLAVPTDLTDVVAIAAGVWHDLALRRDGTVVGWGEDDYGKATPPPGLTEVAAIAAGEHHSLALKRDGTVVTWGSNAFGQQNVPPGLSDVVAIAAGAQGSFALRADGTVVAWGYPYYDLVSGAAALTGVVDIAAGHFHAVALHADGTTSVWGAPFVVADTPQPSNVKSVYAGARRTLFVLEDGSVAGGLDAYVPEGLTGVLALAAGMSHEVALVDPAVVDATAPVADPVVLAGSEGLGGWYTSAVTVDWRWSDDADGIGIDPAACVTTSTSVGDGALTLSATCSDRAGNVGSATFAVAVDATPPALVPVVDPNPVLLGGVATAAANATDAVSGVASASCGPVATGTAGSASVACEASDVAGNVASVEVPYAVHFPYSGFGRPVDDTVVNEVKAGRGVALRFSLGADRGLEILAPGSPRSQAVACGTDTVVDAVETTNAAGASELRYDAASGEYVYVWRTERYWRGTCRTLTLALIDGSQHQATFLFR
jgi:hypothetical protein